MMPFDSIKRRHICWTINNWSQHDLERLRTYATTVKSCVYICWSQEVAPTTGTPHLQGYVAWSNSMSLSAFKKRVSSTPDNPLGRLRAEINTNGTANENRSYCAGLVEKKGNRLNPTFEEFGELPQQGERTDWHRAVDLIRHGTAVVDVVFDQPHLVPTIRALERLETLSKTTPNDRDVRVLYIHGSAGCGKTRSIIGAFPEAYWKPEGEWWDKYTGQQVVVLDDFYSDIAYKTALRVLDRYPLWLPFKGGFVPANYTTVLITSNARLDEQYPNIQGKRREAFYRRIHCVIDADDGISIERITHALSSPPVNPKVQHPQAHKPADDPSPDSTHPQG